MNQPERLLKLLKSRKKGFTAMEIRDRIGISNVADAVMEIRNTAVATKSVIDFYGERLPLYKWPYKEKLITTMETGTNRYGEKVRYARYSLKD